MAVGSTDISGFAYLTEAGKGKVVSGLSEGWLETAIGEALNLWLSAAIAVGGELVYKEVGNP